MIRRSDSGRHWIVGSLLLLVLAAGACKRDPTERIGDPSRPPSGERSQPRPAETFRVAVRHPEGPPLIELRYPDPLGRAGRVTCATCHGTRPPNLENRSPANLREFHQGMPFSHGGLACYACHNPGDMQTLRLADGSVVEYPEVMRLCGQCHGAQARNYARGFHGGMTGYWDLTRGGRERNNCIDCHDPHVPRFPTMQPTFKPRDRFLEPPRNQHPSHGSVTSESGHE